MKKIYLLLGFTSLLQWATFAQDKPSAIYYHGLGRTVIGGSNMNESSNFLKDDSTSERRDLSGQFLFDLETNIEPNDQLRVSAKLRVTNEFGGFFSQGSQLLFRQVRIYGVVANKVAYQIGDIDLEMSPYTLFNNEEMYHEFESSLFTRRRNIMDYENFNEGNAWRLQGGQANFSLLPEKIFSELKFDVFGTRIRQTDYLTTPDRLISGGTISLIKDKQLHIKGRVINLFDVPGTSQDTIIDINNTVFSGEGMYTHKLNSGDLRFVLEAGQSLLNGTDFNTNTSSSQVGGFLDASVMFKSKGRKKSIIELGYRSVSDDFYAAGAQSRRVFVNKTNRLFPAGLNGVDRGITLFDRITDVGLYNQTISTGLMAYNPLISNVSPYGKATPNRAGVTLNATTGSRDSLFLAKAGVDLASDVNGEGVSEKRSFTTVKAGGILNLAALIGTGSKLNVSVGTKYEKTSRGGNADIDLSSMIVDAGIEWEFLSNLDLIIGYKMITGSGNEFARVLDGFNRITQFTGEVQYDESNSVVSLALRYRFSDHNFLSISSNQVSMTNNIDDRLDYDFKQWFVNYTLQF